MGKKDEKNDEGAGEDDKPLLMRLRNNFVGGLEAFIHFLPSPGGLVVILAFYTLFGAVIFYAVEARHERHLLKHSRMTAIKLRTVIANEFFNMSSQHKADNHDAFIQRSVHLLQEYDRLREQSGVEEKVLWHSFVDAIFYAATVYTTIGYGNSYPRTTEGKMFTVLYAIFGIPLCLVVLADLGKLITRGIKTLYRRIQTSLDDNTFPINDEFDFSFTVACAITASYLVIGSIIYHTLEPQWSLFDAFYFLFISGSTIGFGDMVPMASRWFFLAGFVYTFGALVLVSAIVAIMQGKFDEALCSSRDWLEHVTFKRANPSVHPIRRKYTPPTEEEIAEIYGRKPNAKWKAENTAAAANRAIVADKNKNTKKKPDNKKPDNKKTLASLYGTADEYELEVARIYGREPNSWQGKGVVKPPPVAPAIPVTASALAAPEASPSLRPRRSPSPAPNTMRSASPSPATMRSASPSPAIMRSTSREPPNKPVMTSSMVDELIKNIIAADSSLSPSPEDTEVTNLLLSVSSCSSLAASNPQIAQPFGGKMTFEKLPSPGGSGSGGSGTESNSADHQSSSVRPLVTVQVPIPQQPQTSPSTKQQRLSNLAQRCKSDSTSSNTATSNSATSGGTLHTPNSAFTPIASRENSQTRDQQKSRTSIPNEEIPLNDSPNPSDPKAFASPRNVRVTYKSQQSASQRSDKSDTTGAALIDKPSGIPMPSYAALIAENKSSPPMIPRSSAFSSVSTSEDASTTPKSLLGATSSSFSYQQEPPPYLPAKRVVDLSSVRPRVKEGGGGLNYSFSEREDRIPKFNSQLLTEATEFGASIGRSRARRSLSTSPPPMVVLPAAPISSSFMMTNIAGTLPSSSSTNNYTSVYTPSASRFSTSTATRPSPTTGLSSAALLSRAPASSLFDYGSGSPTTKYKLSSRHSSQM